MPDNNSIKSCVVLYSGGMDSTVVLHHALEKYDLVHAVSFDYDQRHRRELDVANDYVLYSKIHSKPNKIRHHSISLCSVGRILTNSSLTNKDLLVPKMKDVIGDPQTSTYVPNRNMMFLSIAASMAEGLGCDTVFYGAAKADDTSGYWDCTQEFRSLLNQILSLNRRNLIQIEAPLIDKNKKQIIEYGLELGVDFSKTHTCYNSYDVYEDEKACGECPSCSARIAGWIQAGRIDPVPYEKYIDWQKYNCVV
jgi:7-cyano-7-deazaguanine synthase